MPHCTAVDDPPIPSPTFREPLCVIGLAEYKELATALSALPNRVIWKLAPSDLSPGDDYNSIPIGSNIKVKERSALSVHKLSYFIWFLIHTFRELEEWRSKAVRLKHITNLHCKMHGQKHSLAS